MRFYRYGNGLTGHCGTVGHAVSGRRHVAIIRSDDHVAKETIGIFGIDRNMNVFLSEGSREA